MNKGILGGFISSDIKSSDVNCKDGTTMKKAKFSIACQRKGKNAGADFIQVTALGKNADNIIKFFGKGRGITVEYHIQTGSYKDKEGKTIYTEDKVVDSFEFPYLRKADEQNTEQPQEQQKENNYTSPTASNEDFLNIPDDIEDELPFKN